MERGKQQGAPNPLAAVLGQDPGRSEEVATRHVVRREAEDLLVANREKARDRHASERHLDLGRPEPEVRPCPVHDLGLLRRHRTPDLEAMRLRACQSFHEARKVVWTHDHVGHGPRSRGATARGSAVRRTAGPMDREGSRPKTDTNLSERTVAARWGFSSRRSGFTRERSVARAYRRGGRPAPATSNERSGASEGSGPASFELTAQAFGQRRLPGARKALDENDPSRDGLSIHRFAAPNETPLWASKGADHPRSRSRVWLQIAIRVDRTDLSRIPCNAVPDTDRIQVGRDGRVHALPTGLHSQSVDRERLGPAGDVRLAALPRLPGAGTRRVTPF